jgi:hypothetical protein
VRRLAAVLSVLVLTMGFARVVTAADCGLCLDAVGLQTRDGQLWTAGKPVTLVVHVTGDAALPETAQAVVMQTDGDRTKCLGVPLKLVQSDASGGLYAGLFFPFRPARYDGKLSIGDDLHDITFDVNQMLAGAAPQGDLPAAEPLDTSAGVPLLIAPEQLLLSVLAVAAIALGLYGRKRVLRTA